jgi:hypothetical protein
MDRSNRPHTLRGKKVVQEKLKQQGLARRNGERLPCPVLNLDYSDLPFIVNGKAGDKESDRPFNALSPRRRYCGCGKRLALYHSQEAA